MFLPYFFFLLTYRWYTPCISFSVPFLLLNSENLTPLSDFLAYCVLSEMLKTTKNKYKLGR